MSLPTCLLYDVPAARKRLLPLTFTRPIGELRVGILSIREKWEFYTRFEASCWGEKYLQGLFPLRSSADQLLLHGGLLPSDDLLDQLDKLPQGFALYHQDDFLAYRCSALEAQAFVNGTSAPTQIRMYKGAFNRIDHPWDIFRLNGAEIRQDFKRITSGRDSEPLTDPFTRVYHPQGLFIEPGASIKAAIINAEAGPVYIGRGADVQEGAILKGPVSIGEGAVINPATRLRQDTTIGPGCKVGGEISNCVFHSNSNKAHDGFLGNSVIGSWCNLGADTNSSNLKNNYASVKVWSYEKEAMIDTGLQFCGLIMGDHSKAGINTMFNTGTVVGVGANIFGGGFPETFIPSFSWGGPQQKWEEYQIDKMLDTARKVMARRQITLQPEMEEMLRQVHQQSHRNRKRFFLI